MARFKPNTKTKYAVIESYYRLAVPIALLDKILDAGVLVELGWDSSGSGSDTVKKVRDITDCKFIEGNDIALAIAEEKLSGG